MQSNEHAHWSENVWWYTNEHGYHFELISLEICTIKYPKPHCWVEASPKTNLVNDRGSSSLSLSYRTNIHSCIDLVDLNRGLAVLPRNSCSPGRDLNQRCTFVSLVIHNHVARRWLPRAVNCAL